MRAGRVGSNHSHQAGTDVQYERLREAQSYSYAVAACSGAVAGAIMLNLCIWLNPQLLLKSVYHFNSPFFAENPEADATTQTHLATGAFVGAVVGLVRTALDRSSRGHRVFPPAIDWTVGMLAGPLAAMGRCFIAPVLTKTWQEIPGIAQTLACAVSEGIPKDFLPSDETIGLFLTGITAALAAKYANEYFAKFINARDPRHNL